MQEAAGPSEAMTNCQGWPMEKEGQRERKDDSRQGLSTRGKESDEESEGNGRRWP